MVPDDQTRPSPKRRPRKGTAGSPISDSETRARFRNEAGDPWLNLGRRLAYFVHVSRGKLDDIYCSAAQFMTEHLEAFEDRLSERKAQARADAGPIPQQGPSARSIPRGTRDAVRDRTVQSSAVRRPSNSRPIRNRNRVLEP